MCLEMSQQIKTLSGQHRNRKANNLVVFFTLYFVKFHFLLLFWFMQNVFLQIYKPESAVIWEDFNY
jgi:cell division protein FtsB